MSDHQSQYTGAQMDAAIAKYVNRSTGQIILTPEQLTGSLSDGYYSGISASFNGSSLNATANDIRQGTTAMTASGKTPGGMPEGTASITLTPDSLSKTVAQNKYVTNASATLDHSSLTSNAGNVAFGKSFIGEFGFDTGTMTLPQFGSFDTGSSVPTSYTITGLTGTPTNIMILKPGWQGKNNSNICALNRFVVVPGGTVDRYHYAVCGYNPSPTSGAGDYTWIADTAIGNCVAWNRSAGSVKITLPKLRLGDSGSLNTQSFFRQTYCWVVW